MGPEQLTRMGRKKLALAAIALAAVVQLSCGTSAPLPEPSPTPTPTPSPTPTPVVPDPEEVLRQTGLVMEGLGTFHFRLHHENGTMELIPGLVIDEVEGDVANPDKLFMTFSGSLGGLTIKASLITLGDSGYITNPLTGEWEAGPTGVSSLGFFDPSRGIAAMTSQVLHPVPAEKSLVVNSPRGTLETYKIAGRLPVEALAPLVGETLEGVTVEVELTIDAQSLYLLEARFEGPVTPTDAEDVVRVISLGAFNEAVTIEPPL